MSARRENVTHVVLQGSWKAVQMIVASLLAGICSFTAEAYQKATKANCDFREAFSKSIDWDDTLQFNTSSAYDANLGFLQAGTYTLSSDLVTGRLVMDNAAKKTVFDLGEGHTMTILGMSSSHAIAATGSGSGETIQLKSGTIVLPFSVR